MAPAIDPTNAADRAIQEQLRQMQLLQAAREHLAQRIEQIKAGIAQLEDQQGHLEEDIHNLEEELKHCTDDSKKKELQDKIAARKDTLTQVKKALAEKQGELTAASEEMAEKQGSYQSIASAQRYQQLQQLSRETTSLDKQRQTAAQERTPALTSSSDHLQKLCEQARQKEQQNTNTLNAVQDNQAAHKVTQEDLMKLADTMAQLQHSYAMEITRLIDEMASLNKQIDMAKVRKNALEHERDELAVAMGVGGFFCVWVAVGLAKRMADVVQGIKDCDNEINGCQQKLDEDMKLLKETMEKLKQLDHRELAKDIEKFTEILEQILNLVLGPQVPGAQEQAMVLMTQLISLIEVMMAKVSKKKSDDNDWMNRGTSAMFQNAVWDAVANTIRIAADLQYKAFMETVMEVAKYGLMAVSVATAWCTGGASMALVAGGQAVLQATGVMDKLTDEIAKGLHCPRWVADLIVTVMVVASSLGASAAAKLMQRSAEKMAEKAAEKLATEALKTASSATRQAVDNAVTNAMATVSSASKAEIEKAATKVVEAAAKQAYTEAAKEAILKGASQEMVKEAGEKAAQKAAQTALDKATMDKLMDTAARKVLVAKAEATLSNGAINKTALTVATAMQMNTLVDFFQWMAQLITGKSKEELENDPVWKAFKIILAVAQMMVAVYGMSKMGGDAQTQGPDKIMGIDRGKIIQALALLQMGGDGATCFANIKTAEIYADMHDAHQRLAQDEYAIMIFKSVLDEFQKMQQNIGDVRAALFEQQMNMISQTVRNAGSPEREMARAFAERAV